MPSLHLPFGRALGSLIEDAPRIAEMLAPVGRTGFLRDGVIDPEVE
jgi:hypothetical protein